jgi:hypothetical protein
VLECHEAVARARSAPNPQAQRALVLGGLLVAGLGGSLIGFLAYASLEPPYVPNPYGYDDVGALFNFNPWAPFGSQPGEEEVRRYNAYREEHERAVGKAVLIGVLCGLGLLVPYASLIVLSRARARDRAGRDLTGKVEGLLAEFPEECQAWGGAGALREAGLARETVRMLEASGGGRAASSPVAPAAPAPPPSREPGKTSVEERLAQLEGLRAKHLVSEHEYRARRQQLLEEL